MFVGIVEAMGQVIAKKSQKDNILFWITCPFLNKLSLGDSVSVNGVCLTVIEKSDEAFCVQVVQETLRKTMLQHLEKNHSVNLESAAKIGDTIGGHLVQGHVDTTAIIENIWEEGVAKGLKIHIDKKWRPYLIPKGFIAIDGVSLTLIELQEDNFTVTLIPYTQQHTISQFYQNGTTVNIEFDAFAKQIHQFLERYHANNQ